MSEEIFSYDEVPYDNKPHPQSHPDRLAVLATLFSMKPTPVNHCRVLELGCGGGGNIIPMAYSLPQSQFLGIEFSGRQVADGQATLTALGLRNVEIRQLSIMDVTKDIGTFDYIIAHGVYSWVPNQVQEKLLQICRENLSPNGVAYISFNTYPGWHFRGMIRDMMLYHTKQFAELPMRIAQARALLDFLAQSVAKENAYGIMLKNELDLLRQHSDSYLFHEHLEAANEPIYFYQFAERAGRHGLQYLAEAAFSTMRLSSFTREVVETLRQVSNEIVRTEQYMDFLRNRTFRQTLLCRKEITLNRNLTPQSVMPFHIASAAKPVSEHVNIHSSQSEVFRMPNGVTLTTANPLVKAAFLYLSEIWPQSVPFDDLLNTARTRMAPVLIKNGKSLNRDVQALGAQLLEGYANNFVTLRMQKAPFIMEIRDRPVASALARHQAKGSSLMTNQLHESGAADVLISHILELLDGCHDRKAILDQLVKLVADGTLVFHKDGEQPREGKSLRSHLAQVVDENLAQIAKVALLIG